MGKNRLTILLILGSAVVAVVTLIAYLNDNSLNVFFLDVGQGDAILIQTPDDKYILVDGGPGDDVLSQLNEVVPPWVRKIDYVVLTHPDADHVTGLVEVLRYYDVDFVAFEDIDHDSNVYREFRKVLSEEDFTHITLRDDDDFVIGCCTHIDVLWPKETTDIENVDPVNNISTSFRLIYKDFSVVLAGDAESASEDIIASISNLDSDILKISHHGSNTSSTESFLESTNPEYAVISVGRDNRFGHPTYETLEKLRIRKIETFRTDHSGRVQVNTDGSYLKFICELGCDERKRSAID